MHAELHIICILVRFPGVTTDPHFVISIEFAMIQKCLVEPSHKSLTWEKITSKPLTYFLKLDVYRSGPIKIVLVRPRKLLLN